MPEQGLCAGGMILLIGLPAAMPGSKAFGTAGSWKSFVFLPAQLWLLADEREQLFPKVAFQYAVQELQVTDRKYVLVQPLGPSPWPG